MSKETDNTFKVIDPRANRHPVPDRKYYGLFAVNKEDPLDIIGYIENSFSMGWSYTHVNLQEGFKTFAVIKAASRDAKVMAKEYPDDASYAKWFQRCWSKLCMPGMTVDDMRKAHWQMWYETKQKSMLAQNAWNSISERAFIPVGYELKVFRVNSKICPVEVDLRYRIAWNKGWIKTWDKWKWRNAPFMIKGLNAPGTTWEDIKPTLAESFTIEHCTLGKIETNWQFGKSCPRKIKCDAFGWPEMSRTEMKNKLRSQRKEAQ